VVRMRSTRGHTGNRRSHHALKIANLGKCAHCSALKSGHAICLTCGHYKGRQVLDILKKTAKKTSSGDKKKKN
ncbi:50S ribosomal protein L32, partial [Candidatus Nomurabacteria bacterium RIFCSPLOWO2_02_FULL_42_17]